MLVNGSRLSGFPVLSLHIGGPTAFVKNVIIDPRKMKIVGFLLEGPLINGETGDILQSEFVREYSNLGMIIDSLDVVTMRGEVKRMDEVMELGFQMMGLPVVTKKGAKLGKVSDYVVTTDDFRVMQIVVKRPLMKSLTEPELVISRKEIVEISNERIVVKDEEETIKKRMVKEDFVPNFVNPFRDGAYLEGTTEEY